MRGIFPIDGLSVSVAILFKGEPLARGEIAFCSAEQAMKPDFEEWLHQQAGRLAVDVLRASER